MTAAATQPTTTVTSGKKKIAPLAPKDLKKSFSVNTAFYKK